MILSEDSDNEAENWKSERYESLDGRDVSTAHFGEEW